MSWDEDYELLEANGWTVECQSPFEISTKDGCFARGQAAHIVLNDLKYEHHFKFTEKDMHDCFSAGVNRGVTIAAIITKRNIGEEFPPYKEYMKRYDEED